MKQVRVTATTEEGRILYQNKLPVSEARFSAMETYALGFDMIEAVNRTSTWSDEFRREAHEFLVLLLSETRVSHGLPVEDADIRQDPEEDKR